MERKSHISKNVNSAGLQRSNYPRKILHYSNPSSIPRLPPILQKDICNSPPTHPRRKRQPEKIQRDFSLDSNQPKTTLLPKLERNHFEANTVYFKVNNDVSKQFPSDMSPRFVKPEVKSTDREFGYLAKQETSLSSSILGIRRKKKDRLSSYKCAGNTVIDDEILQLEQRVGFDAISAPNPTNVKDMKGRMIQSGDTYNEGVTSLITMLDEDEKTKKKSGKEPENESPKKSPRCTSVRQRFLKALDAHFFNEFVSSKPARRMAICEELEKTISGDGKTSLTGLREHLRLQDVLDSWVL